MFFNPCLGAIRDFLFPYFYHLMVENIGCKEKGIKKSEFGAETQSFNVTRFHSVKDGTKILGEENIKKTRRWGGGENF